MSKRKNENLNRLLREFYPNVYSLERVNEKTKKESGVNERQTEENIILSKANRFI